MSINKDNSSHVRVKSLMAFNRPSYLPYVHLLTPSKLAQTLRLTLCFRSVKRSTESIAMHTERKDVCRIALIMTPVLVMFIHREWNVLHDFKPAAAQQEVG